jgi:integrase
MEEKYKVSFVTFSDGERYPILLNSKGQPHWYPTLYLTTRIRNASKAPNTMAAVLAAMRVLFVWADSFGQDLEYRFAQRQFLTDREIESLRYYIQTKADGLTSRKKNTKKISKIECIRGKIRYPDNKVSSSTQYIRITYIADYLEWLAIRFCEGSGQVNAELIKLIQKMTNGLRFLRPQKTVKSREAARRGLTEPQKEALLNILKPGSMNNPFSQGLQTRNQLIILLLYHLGLRAGELLSLRISDFDFQNNTLLVARRHDNPADPRTHQPVVKTIDRRVPLSEALIRTVSEYIMRDRRQYSMAKRHDYLFVVHQAGPFSGQPLSLKGLAKLFQEIKGAESALFDTLTPHVLRHTANDQFSKLMDKRGATPAEEEKMRSYLMGWKEGSGTAGTYTRRHIENKAREAALLLQNSVEGVNSDAH